MSNSRKLIVPALFALGVFALAPMATGLTGAIADGKLSKSFKASGLTPGGNGAGNKNGGGTGAGSKNGGGVGGGNKNGGGNGGNGGGAGGGNKNGGGNSGNGGGNNGGNGGGDNGGNSFGSSGSNSYQGNQIITCVINGQLIAARSVSECRYGRGFVQNGDSYFGGGGFVQEPRYVQRRVIRRRVEANFGYEQPRRYAGQGGGYAVGTEGNGGDYGGGGYGSGFGGGGYGAGGDVYVGSNAAVMQSQRRARESGYGVDGGYGGTATYGNGSSYAYGGGYGEEQGYGMRRHHVRYANQFRQHRHAHRYMGGYGFGADAGGCNCYNSGYVVHYGPTISKDGGY